MSDNSSLPVLTAKKALICWSGALLPVVLSLLAHLVGPQAQAAPEPRPKPTLVFSQYMIDEGTPPVKPLYRAAFEFRNLGDRTITIEELKPSCGCLNPRLEKSVYKPGEIGEFWIRVDPTKEKPGPREFFVDVHYTDPDPHSIRVTYKITLPERNVEIVPKALVFYQLEGNNAETEQEVVISDYRGEGKGFHILSMESTSPLARAVLVKREEDEGGNIHHRLSVTVSGKVPPGTSRVLINIRTDDPEFDLLQIPILISGPKPSVSKADLPLKVDPEALFLQADPDRALQTSLMFYDFQPQPAELEDVSLTSIDGTVETGPVEQSPLGPLVRQRKISLSLKIPPSVQEHKGLLVIETDSQLQPRIEVPIVIQAP
jgi:hypothetical protein